MLLFTYVCECVSYNVVSFIFYLKFNWNLVKIKSAAVLAAVPWTTRSLHRPYHSDCEYRRIVTLLIDCELSTVCGFSNVFACAPLSPTLHNSFVRPRDRFENVLFISTNVYCVPILIKYEQFNSHSHTECTRRGALFVVLYAIQFDMFTVWHGFGIVTGTRQHWKQFIHCKIEYGKRWGA